MRGLRSTIALLVVLIGLGAYSYFVVSKKSADTTATKQEKLFPSLEASKIDELKVKSESGEVTTLKKEGESWNIIAPVQTRAADTEATGVANALGDIDVVRVVEENPTDLKVYGLDPPQLDVEFKSADGKTAGHLLVGAKAAAGANRYAKRADEKRVVLIAQFHEGALNKSPSTFATNRSSSSIVQKSMDWMPSSTARRWNLPRPTPTGRWSSRWWLVLIFQPSTVLSGASRAHR